MNDDLLDENIEIKFSCKPCKADHTIKISKDLFDTDKFPVTYGYLHGDPPIIATLYIDANKKVRGVEFTNDFGVNQDQLSETLERSQSLILTSIPEEMILGFELIQGKTIKKIYYRKGYEKAINFPEIFKIWKGAEKFLHEDTTLNEFFLRFSEMWIAGLRLEEYIFMIIVDAQVDIEHLKTQAMAIMEAFLN